MLANLTILAIFMKNYIGRDEFNQEKMRGQRGRLPVQALGYVNSTKVIFGLSKTAGVRFRLSRYMMIRQFRNGDPGEIRFGIGVGISRWRKESRRYIFTTPWE